jgi:hypothetical protein
MGSLLRHTLQHFFSATASELTVSGFPPSHLAANTHLSPSVAERSRYLIVVALFSLFSFAFLLTACGGGSANDSTTNSPTPPETNTYYLSPSGNDSNSGTSPNDPWLSPNHSLKCGNVIMAAASTAYSAANFYSGKWGTVNCPASNNVAWLTCATFDACKISATDNQGMWVDQSYWGVEGWEITTSASDADGTCFLAAPAFTSPAEIHHIVFANDIANGCAQGGFALANHGNASVDYFAVIGSIAYNTTQGATACTSGISAFQPIQSDSLPGTHIFVAGNFSWANIDGNPCAGAAPTDGEGVNFDTWDFGGVNPYMQQGLIENNIIFLNGGFGIEIEHNSQGSANAHIYIRYNTLYGDRRDMNQIFCSGNGDLTLNTVSNVDTSFNLIYTGYPTGCEGNPTYAINVSAGNATDTITNTFASGVNGYDTFFYNPGSFVLGTGNIIGTDPAFANPVNPGAPSCSGSSSVPTCMQSVISDYTPTVTAAKSFGYQQVSATNTPDPLFPQWLCTASVPSGLITMGCQ